MRKERVENFANRRNKDRARDLSHALSREKDVSLALATALQAEIDKNRILLERIIILEATNGNKEESKRAEGEAREKARRIQKLYQIQGAKC